MPRFFKHAVAALAAAFLLSGCSLVSTGVQMARHQQRQDDMKREQAAREQAQKAAEEAEQKAFEQALADIRAAKDARDSARVVEIHRASNEQVKKREYRKQINTAAVEAVIETGDFARYADEYMVESRLGSSVGPSSLEAKFGRPKMVELAKKHFTTAAFDGERGWRQYDVLVQYLRNAEALRAELCPSVLRHLSGQKTAVTAVYVAGELKCKVEQKKLADLMVSDNWAERRNAVWTVGQLEYKGLKKKVESVRWNDPMFDKGCLCYPVRNEAAKVLTRFTE